MAATTPPSITALPSPPDPNNRSTFNTLAYPWSLSQQVLATELEALADNVYDNAVEAKNQADSATSSASTATIDATTATTQAGIATTAATTATTQAGIASTQATAASGDRALAQTAAATATTQAAAATAAAAGASATVLGVSTALPALRPSLLLDFANSRQVDPRITFTRASAATRINEMRLIETVAAGVPRIDFDPVTLACKSWLIEESRTNYITNNTMQGTVVDSPGTAPTGWSVAGTGSGLTRSVVAIGEEDGISYIDIRFNGTPTVNNVSIVFAAIAAASGQAWGLSVYLRLVGGSFANTVPELDILESDGTTGLAANRGPCVATGQPLVTQRFVVAATLSNAGTTHVQPRIRVGLTIGQPVDFTLRIGLPQFEAGGFATSVIRTAGAAVTRAADVPVMTGSNFSSWYRQDEGAFVVFARRGSLSAGRLITLSDGTASNQIRINLAVSSTSLRAVLEVVTGGVSQVSTTTTPVFAVGSLVAIAFAYKDNDFAISVNGTTVVTATSGTVPTVDRMYIGTDQSGASSHNGTVARISHYPKRLTNLELQALTAQ